MRRLVYDQARSRPDPRLDPREGSARDPRSGGFTLVEVVLSLALIAVILVSGTDLLWQVVSARLQSAATREVRHNAAAVVRRMAAEIREAQALGQGSGQSTFGSHPGKVTLDNPGAANDVMFDTATKAVTVGGQSVTIRKLRVAAGGGASLDLTSDDVDVTNFVVRDLTRAGAPATVRLELTVAAVNPGNDPNRRASFSLETSVTLRR